MSYPNARDCEQERQWAGDEISRQRRDMERRDAEIAHLRSGLEEIATHEQNVGATVIYSGEWCVNKAKEVLKLCKNLL